MNLFTKISAFALLAALLSGCANGDYQLSDFAADNATEVNLTIQLDNQAEAGGDPRQMYSTDNWQHVTNVYIYFFKSDTPDGPFILTGQPIYVADSNKSEIWKNEPFEQHKLSIRPRLTAGYYRILAVGIDTPESAGITPTVLAQGTDWNAAIISCNSNTNPTVNEVFSGFVADNSGKPKTIKLAEDGARIYETLELRRSVAGILLYVKNIPAQLTVDKNAVDIAAVGIVCKRFMRDCDIVNRRCTGVDTEPTDAQDYICLATVFTEGTPDADGYFPTPVSNGIFMLPSQLSTVADSEKSLYLCYYSQSEVDGKQQLVPVLTRPIRITQSEPVNPDSDFAKDLNLSADGYRFNIVANHLYCLGSRDIDKDTDDPLDLKEQQDIDIVIEICPNYDYVHDITIN